MVVFAFQFAGVDGVNDVADIADVSGVNVFVEPRHLVVVLVGARFEFRR
jgi:hypothetical protein